MQVKHIINEMQEFFLHECAALGRCSGFCQRASSIRPQAWVQGLVLGWLDNPHASVCALARALAVAGAPVSPQAVDKRFGVQGAALLQAALERLSAYALQEAARHSLTSKETSELAHFSAIWLRDSTIIPLPAALAHLWPGTGSRADSRPRRS